MKYSIVIVTYNRCSLLKECIQCALNQTFAASHIIVIDNASTDGTAAYLGNLAEPGLLWKRMEKNLGGAGGFYEGLKWAYELHDDYHIIIDDDAMLAADFAALLCEKAEMYPEVMAFAGSVMTNGEIVQDHRQLIKRPGYRMEKIAVSEYQKELFYCDTASFCGVMIRNQVIAAVGLPEKDYFIWFDDTEYCVRIRKLSKIMVIPKAKLNHKVAVTQEQWPRHYTWKDYYGIRNRIHMVKKHGGRMDYLWMRLSLWLNSGLRNRLFSLIRLHKESWKGEVDIYKRGVRDGKIFKKDTILAAGKK